MKKTLLLRKTAPKKTPRNKTTGSRTGCFFCTALSTAFQKVREICPVFFQNPMKGISLHRPCAMIGKKLKK